MEMNKDYFKKETEAAKIKMLEFGITIPFNVGLQVKDFGYGELRKMSNNFLISNMRRLSSAFTEFVDPDVPELQDYGTLSRKEVYFVLRSILLEKKREAQRAEVAKIRKELDGMKTKREKRKELEVKLKKLEA